MDTVRQRLVSFFAPAGSMTAIVLRARQCRLQRLLAELEEALVDPAVSIPGFGIIRGAQSNLGMSDLGIV